MRSCELRSEEDGLRLHWEDDGNLFSRWLGTPRDSLYHSVPESLWTELAEHIEEHRRLLRDAADYHNQVCSDYLSSRGIRNHDC